MCNEIKPILRSIVIYYYCTTGKTLYNDLFKKKFKGSTMVYKLAYFKWKVLFVVFLH